MLEINVRAKPKVIPDAVMQATANGKRIQPFISLKVGQLYKAINQQEVTIITTVLMDGRTYYAGNLKIGDNPRLCYWNKYGRYCGNQTMGVVWPDGHLTSTRTLAVEVWDGYPDVDSLFEWYSAGKRLKYKSRTKPDVASSYSDYPFGYHKQLLGEHAVHYHIIKVEA